MKAATSPFQSIGLSLRGTPSKGESSALLFLFSILHTYIHDIIVARKACFKTFTIVFLTFSFGTFTFDGSLCFLGAYIIIGNGFRVR